MKAALSWIVRILLLAVCAYATQIAIRIAVADWMAAADTPEALERAIRLQPADAVLVVRAALRHSNTGDMSSAVDRELLRAASANPLDSGVPMALGLREEFRGNTASAERYLIRAAEMDHTFKPGWTLANFYFRTNQPDRIWPLVRRSLALEPFPFDPSPVFDLCWNATTDSSKIASLIPLRGPVPLQYLNYLADTKRDAAAIEFWPRALAAAEHVVPIDIAGLTAFPNFLLNVNRVPEAVRSWNQLVERRIVISGHLDPMAGTSVADPDFTFPLLERAFGWQVAHPVGVSVAKASSGLRFEFDGNEPEAFRLLATVAPVLPGKAYRLTWKADASRLSSPRDPGLKFRILQTSDVLDSIIECRLLPVSDGVGECRFTSRPDIFKAGIDLQYIRAPGTTRVGGVVRITGVRLEFAS
jgi:tetratricopeptide (TPR) repeat protein